MIFSPILSQELNCGNLQRNGPGWSSSVLVLWVVGSPPPASLLAEFDLGRIGARHLFHHRLPAAHDAPACVKGIGGAALQLPPFVEGRRHFVTKGRCVVVAEKTVEFHDLSRRLDSQVRNAHPPERRRRSGFQQWPSLQTWRVLRQAAPKDRHG